MKQNVGVIGLGAMGGGMARSLRRAGYARARVRRAAGCGRRLCRRGRHRLRHRRRSWRGSATWSSGWSSTRRRPRAVLFGDGGGAAAMKPGSVFVMCSTVDPAWSAALEVAPGGSCGILYLDAPISGGAAKAAAAR